MAWLNAEFTIDDALAQGMDTWDLLIDDWGNVDAADPTSFAFPAVGSRGLPTIYGMAIGNQSDVDRVFVAYSIEKLIPSNVDWDVAHRLSVKAPLMFTQIGQREIVRANLVDPNAETPATGKATVVLYPRASVAGGSSNNNGGMPTTLWGADIVDPDGTAAVAGFVNPLLHVVFFLKPPAVGPSYHRNDSSTSVTWTDLSSVVYTIADGLGTSRAGVPVFGRKTLVVSGSATAAAAPGADVLVEVRGYRANADAVGRQERVLGNFTLTGGRPNALTITNPDVDVVTVYAKRAAGNEFVIFNVRASDD